MDAEIPPMKGARRMTCSVADLCAPRLADVAVLLESGARVKR